MAKKKEATNKKKKKVAKNQEKRHVDNHLWYAFIPMIAAFVLYFNTLNHQFVLDDDLVCIKNKFVQKKGIDGLGDIFTSSFHEGFTGNPDANYRPMMMAAFTIEKALFREKINGSTRTPESVDKEAKIYHFFNIFWYAIACGILYLLLLKIFEDKHYWLPLGITLLFVAHPIHTEVVANIKSRDEIFVMLGMVGTLFSILKYDETSKIKWLVLSLLSYFFATLSKESGLQIIALVPLTLFFFSKEINSLKTFSAEQFKKLGITTAYFLIPTIIYFLLRMQFTGDNGQTLGIVDNTLYAASGMGERLATAIYMAAKYLWLLIVPVNLSFDYSAYQIPIINFANPKAFMSLLIWVGILGFAIHQLKSKNPISYGILLYVIMFAVVSNILFLMGVTMAERLVFSPSLGFCFILGYLLFKYLAKEKDLTIYWTVLGVICILYSYKTINRNYAWKNNATLFPTGVVSAPNSARTLSFYGKHLYDQSKGISTNSEKVKLVNEAIEYYTKAIEINPTFVDVYQNKGLALESLGKYNEAIEIFKTGIEMKPDYHLAYGGVGLCYSKLGNNDKALEYFSKAVDIVPNNISALNNLGFAYMQKKDYNSAITYYKRSYDKNPNSLGTVQALRDCYRTLGQIETAIFYDKQMKTLKGEPIN